MRICPGICRPHANPRAACGLLLWCALSALTTNAWAQQPPSENELRSIYCVEVVRAEIGLQHGLISASDEAASTATTPALRQQWIDTTAELLQGLAKLEGVLNRLQSYMLPRMHTLDAYALATAIRQGDTDVEESRAIADRCATVCNVLHAMDERQACSASCSDNVLLTRVSACLHPSWLPL